MSAWAANLHDFGILAKLTNGTLFVQDAVYHKTCMSRYYNRHISCLTKTHNKGKNSQYELQSIALADIVAYSIEDDSDGPFYIIDLAELYKNRLRELGGVVPEQVHTSHLQERILSQFHGWKVKMQRKNCTLHVMLKLERQLYVI